MNGSVGKKATNYGSMEKKNEKEAEAFLNEESLEDESEKRSIWSRLVFGWLSPLLDLGNSKKKLDPDDLDLVKLPLNCQTNHAYQQFKQYWPSSGSFVKALFQAFGLDFLKAGLLKLIHDTCIFVGPQVLHGLIAFLRDPDASLWSGLGLTLAVTLSQLTMSFCLRHYFFKCYLTGLRVRTAVVVAVYQKALVLDAAARSSFGLGRITNLMTIDAQRCQDLTTYLHAIWYSFLQIGLALYFLWQQLGASCLGGVLVISIQIPVTKTVAQWLGRIQKSLMEKRDHRVEVNSEVLSSMKVIKLQAWEESFLQKLTHLRSVELQKLWNYVLANCVSIMLWSATPLCVALATFCAYVLSGHELEVASALTALALFDILRFPLFMLPQIINRIVDASISLNRVHTFLLSEEYHAVGEGSLDADGEIQLRDATYCYESKKHEVSEQEWEIALLKAQLQDAEQQIQQLMSTNKKEEKEKDETEPLVDSEPKVEGNETPHSSDNLLCIKRANLQVKQGQLIAVIGGVGCGKSSLLNAILGEEVRQLQGHISLKGSLSYFAQTPFIFNDTLRNNILFGLPYHHARYSRVLDSCALRHDLELLSAGDLTEIGEKGITLSGGQKARVALARCLYADSQIVLLDDPLAAVDAHVGNQLFQQAILEDMVQQGKTVILVTNALQYLNHPLVDRIVVVRDGRMAEQGTFQELMAIEHSLLGRFMEVLQETGVSPTETEGCGTDDSQEQVVSSSEGTEIVAATKETTVTNDSPDKDDSDKKKKGALMTDEFQEREVGHVDRKVYLAWGRAAGGTWVPIVILLVYGAVEAVNVSTKWWLTYWSQHGTEENQLWFLAVYAAINLFAIFAAFLRLLLLMSCSLRASRRIFERLLQVVLQAPMSFFDTTPIGRIINRFSKDMYTIDEQLISTLRSYLATLFNVFSTIIVISGVTPIFTLCLIPILIFYSMQQAYFTMTYRELKRLDSIGRSPIYALLSETLDGVTTIRAFKAQPILARRLDTMLDRQQHAYYLTFASQCWLAIRLELVGTLIITFACLCSVLEHPFKGGDESFAGLAGLSISFALSVTQSLNWSVRMASDFEANMVAVERVEQYCSIPNEAKRYTDADKHAGTDWPARGEIQFIDAKLRYRPGLPLVLKGLDIAIPAGSKVGIVGRTGAGKSTLMVALLRIVELDFGKILIDGIDHKNLGLALVRSKIAVIPQDPVLFSGTVRTNLDPFEEYPDERLLDALTRVGLYNTAVSASASSMSLSSLGNAQVRSLSDSVLDGGSNFSVGQRQLLVIARALLCGASIVIMDEATAAVDADTDARIQGVMRTEFKKATTLTVAHRINTIMDSDFILVMDDGKAAEFDSPSNLLDRGGMFKDLVDAAAKEGH